MQTEIRINRFFTDNGIISRREADRAIISGRVLINGKPATLGAKVTAHDTVSLDGRVVAVKAKAPVILAYNKPLGIECTTDASVPENIIDAVNYPQRIFPIGRLDKYSEGLILLTNMGEIVNKILRSRFEHEKEYLVAMDHPLTSAELMQMRKGVCLSDGWTKPCKVYVQKPRLLRIILTEGRNRQIRRLMEYFATKVVSLKRIRVMNIQLGNLPVGKYRLLSAPEKNNLLKALEKTDSLPVA